MRLLAAPAALGLLLLALAPPSHRAESATGSRWQLVETVRVPNSRARPTSSSHRLDPLRLYRLAVRGTVQMSQSCGRPFAARTSGYCSPVPDGYDALYCYVCQPPELRRSLRINGGGLDELGTPVTIPYSPRHVYQKRFTGVSGRLQFVTADEDLSDNGGAWKIRLYEGPPRSVDLAVRPNDQRHETFEAPGSSVTKTFSITVANLGTSAVGGVELAVSAEWAAANRGDLSVTGCNASVEDISLVCSIGRLDPKGRITFSGSIRYQPASSPFPIEVVTVTWRIKAAGDEFAGNDSGSHGYHFCYPSSQDSYCN